MDAKVNILKKKGGNIIYSKELQVFTIDKEFIYLFIINHLCDS